MASRPVHEMDIYTEAGLKGYVAIWNHILNHDGDVFTVSDIELKTNVIRQTVLDYIKRLLRAKYIEYVGTIGEAKTYRVINPVTNAPRLTRKGVLSKQGIKRDHMWRAMKMLKRFTKHDLAVHASTEDVKIKVNSAEDYIKFLCKAGYLVCTREGKPNRAAEYMFLRSKNTGPRPPMIQRVKNVYDPNLKKVVWSSNGGANE